MLVLACADLRRAAADRRRRGGDVRRGAARHRPRVRRRPARAPPPAGPGRERRQPASAAGRLGDRGQPPVRRSPRPGRLLAALRAAGRGRRPRHARPRRGAWPTRSCARRSTTRWCWPTAGSSRAATSTGPRSRSRATSSRSRPPRSARSPSGGPTGCSIATRSQGLPPFLAEDPGVDSGLMIAHYTQAAMVAENRRLAAPASVDSIPTSAMQEDHVSMGWGAARKLRRALDEPRPHPRGRAPLRRARARPARAAAPGAGTGAALSTSASGFPGQAPTGGWPPSWQRPRSS